MTRREQQLGDAAGIFAVVLVFYTLAAALAMTTFSSDVGRAFFYPAAGVTVAVAILVRRSQWPAIVAAVILGEAMSDLFVGHASVVAAGYTLAGVVEPIVGATLTLAWCGGIPDLRNRRHLATFVAAACLAGPAVGAVIGGTTTHLFDQSGWVENVVHRWIGDGLGVLVVATPILLWTKQSAIVRVRLWEAAAVVALTAGASAAAFMAQIPPSILILPFLAWSALRLDMLGAALAGGGVAFVAAAMAPHGYGALQSGDFSPSGRLMLDQLFVTIVMAVALLMAREGAARIHAVRERETERRDRVQIQGLALLAQQLSAALVPKDIGRALENHVLREAGAQGVALGLLSPDGEEIEWVAAPGYPQQVHDKFNPRSGLDSPFLGAEVVRSGEPVMIRSRAEYETRYGASVRWLEISDSQSIAGWPLNGGGKPFGVLMVIWAESQSFDATQVAYLSAVTTLVSQALVRARIYVDEHTRAAVLQSALVPDKPPDTAGLDLCVAYEPAEKGHGLGGDWYDVLSLPQNRIYFAMGDVIGHGLPAVEDMAQLRTAGRALAHYGLPPAQLLGELNAFTRHASVGKFATMVVAVFDFTTGELAYCTAGHPPPLLRRAATGEVVRLCDTAGAVLGPLSETGYVEGTLRICRDDVLVMYTDGLVERRGSDIDTGISAAARMIAEWPVDSPLADSCAMLHQTLAPPPRSDDMCIIAVRFPETRGAPINC